MTDRPIPFKKILIANRGEIAVRVIRTLDALGIASVAVYHHVERRAKHVRMATEAVELKGASPVAAHLDGAQIVAAALACGADAIHPGYGFLSERAGFARLCEQHGIVFIGPTSAQLAAAGDKLAARALAQEVGVPLAPGGDVSSQDAARGRQCGA